MSNESREAFDVDYGWDKMPSGPFVGGVYMLTHDVAKALGVEFERGSDEANQRFIAAETAIRDYVWKAAKRANQPQLLREQRDAWQDIESAPLTASRLMVTDGTWFGVAGRLSSGEYHAWCSFFDRFDGTQENNRTNTIMPTHWQPLPTPPALTRADGRE